MSDLVIDGAVEARANVNIALIKYWGKAPADRPEDKNLPAVPSLSLTLDGLYTVTQVAFDPEADTDRVFLGGVELDAAGTARARVILDRVRALADVAAPFRVDSVNHVPTAAGLASSASSMAALAAASARCAGLDLDAGELSELARLGSGSASRSVFGGWVAWEGRRAHPVAPIDHWDLAVVIAVIGTGPKAIGSRAAMERTARTSPLYPGWVAQAHETFTDALSALERRDFEALVGAMERSTMRMHASALGADPPVLYWQAASVAVLREVERMRADGLACGFTMDAGPNVKVFCAGADVEAVSRRLTPIPGVAHTFVARPGEGVSVRLVNQERP
ncbi:MAG: diphosphomevalonate decarboxylase [Deltaproteobacteria bacterium]|nr:MAG: diphosphomevalonate decarboxylase [Deltaproteobacteria bacterium]